MQLDPRESHSTRTRSPKSPSQTILLPRSEKLSLISEQLVENPAAAGLTLTVSMQPLKMAAAAIALSDFIVTFI